VLALRRAPGARSLSAVFGGHDGELQASSAMTSQAGAIALLLAIVVALFVLILRLGRGDALDRDDTGPENEGGASGHHPGDGHSHGDGDH
jgi:hypothetical protein